MEGAIDWSDLDEAHLAVRLAAAFFRGQVHVRHIAGPFVVDR